MIEVVAAILENKGKILIAKRKSGKSLAGFWEFPGGKKEIGETSEEALKRELMEELLIEVELKEYVGESIYEYPDKTIKLIAFSALITKGVITLLDHDEYKWVNLNQISKFKMAPADIPLIDFYRKKSSK